MDFQTIDLETNRFSYSVWNHAFVTILFDLWLMFIAPAQLNMTGFLSIDVFDVKGSYLNYPWYRNLVEFANGI